MESLVLLAAVLFLITILGGPIALGLSYLPTRSGPIHIARLILIFVLSLPAVYAGLNFLFSPVGFGARIIGGLGTGVAGFAMYRALKQIRQ